MKRFFPLLLPVLLTALMLPADEASAPYADTSVSARLHLNIKEDTDVVHFVRDKVRPEVYTKIYVLKHADPYEIRAHLTKLVHARKVNDRDTGIQAIRYNDGVSMLMISAEDYRFDENVNGESLDHIIETLDKPGIVDATGRFTYLYTPKFRDASELRVMVENVGAAVVDDVTENIGASDRIRCDAALNAMMITCAPFSRLHIENALKEYDRPYPEVRAKVTIYEIYAENDAKMGLDFQAWKNNDGIDLFSGGAKYMQNYAVDGSALSQGSGWSDLQYFNFNPKWNTKYVDFLVSKGKAKVLHICEISARNNTQATVSRTSQIFYAKAEPIENSEYTVAYIHLPDTSFSTSPQAGNAVVKATTLSGSPVTVVANDGEKATLTVLQLAKNPAVANCYRMDIEKGHFEADGRNLGTSIEVGSVSVVCYENNAEGKLVGTQKQFVPNNVAAEKGNQIFTEASDEFGFKMNMTPSITDEATILDVQITNSSLIGYQSSGEPRIQKSAEVSSKFMISNAGTKLVIGGVDKRDVVRVSGGLPFLKDLPGLGWLLSTESESTKRSQLLVVAEVRPVLPGETLSDAETKEIRKIEKDLEAAGETNDWGYRQFLIDPERRPSSSSEEKQH